MAQLNNSKWRKSNILPPYWQSLMQYRFLCSEIQTCAIFFITYASTTAINYTIAAQNKDTWLVEAISFFMDLGGSIQHSEEGKHLQLLMRKYLSSSKILTYRHSLSPPTLLVSDIMLSIKLSSHMRGERFETRGISATALFFLQLNLMHIIHFTYGRQQWQLHVIVMLIKFVMRGISE